MDQRDKRQWTTWDQYSFLLIVDLFLVGNKIDLDESEKISYDSAATLASEYNAIIKLTSAKENRGIDELF